MINEHLRKRLKKDRPTTKVTLGLPLDVVESLKTIASTVGFNLYQTLLRRYISEGLRREGTELTLTDARERPKAMGHIPHKRKNPHIGSSFDTFLKEEGNYEDAQNAAIRHLLASDIAKAMKGKHLTKVQMAKRMRLSLAQLTRLLDPDDPNVTLACAHRAASTIGRKLLLDLV